MKNIIILATLLLLSAAINAGTIKTTPDMIKSFRVGSGGNIVTVYKGTRSTVNPANCLRSYPLQLSKNAGEGVGEEAFDQMFSAIMAAKMASNPVVLFISDDRCSGKYPSIVYVEVR